MSAPERTGALILARVGSSRLPGKVLKTICGKTILEHVVLRLRQVAALNEIVVATTVNPTDDAIATLCDTLSVPVFRGSEDNVLDRCAAAAKVYGLGTILRLGADCPVVDPKLVTAMLERWHQERALGKPLAYLSNTLERTYPVGLDAEIFDATTFDRIIAVTRTLPDDERLLNESNVIPYLHQHLEEFPSTSHTGSTDLSLLRWTLDTPEDFELIRRIYEALYPENPDFGTDDILRLLDRFPDWSAINSAIVPRTGYWTVSEQRKLQERFGQGHGR